MEIVKLEIRKRSSYEDYANQLAGTVQLQGALGKQEILLSSAVVAEIFKIIKDDLVMRSTTLASQTSTAAEEAMNSPLLTQATVIDNV